MAEGSAEVTSPAPVLKQLDAWWTVVAIDPLAVRLARALGRFPIVTATSITVLAHLLGVASAGCFFTGRLVWGAVIFEVRFVLDCADGKLARMRGTSSSTGAYLDYVGDYVVVAANMACIALHLLWAGDVSAVVAVALPTTFLAHVTAGQARDGEALAAGVADRPAVERLPGRYRAWMARRRLRSSPSRIEAEHLLLFAAPLAAVFFDAEVVLAWVATGVMLYFAYRAVRIGVGGYRIAAERDRTRTAGA